MSSSIDGRHPARLWPAFIIAYPVLLPFPAVLSNACARAVAAVLYMPVNQVIKFNLF